VEEEGLVDEDVADLNDLVVVDHAQPVVVRFYFELF